MSGGRRLDFLEDKDTLLFSELSKVFYFPVSDKIMYKKVSFLVFFEGAAKVPDFSELCLKKSFKTLNFVLKNLLLRWLYKLHKLCLKSVGCKFYEFCL